MLIATLLLAAAAAVPAQEFAAPSEAGALILGARAAAVRIQQIPTNAAALPQAKAVAPINQGFQGLGATGKTGTIDGPGLRLLPGQHVQGDGTYRVTQNDPFQVVLQVNTGYIDGTFTLKRDPATGKDSLGFAGRLWNQDSSAWGAAASGSYAGQVAYDAASDSGVITWSLGGTRYQDKFHGGRSGSRAMTIELTGYAHDFKQN